MNTASPGQETHGIALLQNFRKISIFLKIFLDSFLDLHVFQRILSPTIKLLGILLLGNNRS